MRANDSDAAGAPRLPAAGDRRRCRAAASSSSARAGPAARSTPASSRRSPGCSWIPSSCSASSAIPPSASRGAAYRITRSRVGVAAVVLPLEQHPRRGAARGRGEGTAAGSRGARAAGAADAGRSAFRRRSSPTSPRSGCSCGTCARSRPTSTCSRSSTTTCGVAMQRETELFIESQMREDRRVGELLDGELHVPERAPGAPLRHRRVSTAAISAASRLPTTAAAACSGRAAILTVTSHATRTSPVLRGKWVLDNVLGAPPPPPPPDVPALPEKGDDGEPASVRARLEQHRSNPVCASCHSRMDPLGFALENFDAIGKWRATTTRRRPIDASATLPDGTKFDGPGELRSLLASRREEFVADADGEAADLRARPRRSNTTIARPSAPSSATRRRPTTAGRPSSRHCRERAVSDEEGRAMIVTEKPSRAAPFCGGLARPLRFRCSTPWCRRLRAAARGRCRGAKAPRARSMSATART